MSSNILEKLPVEIIVYIATFLGWKDRLNLRRVSKFLNETIMSNKKLQSIIRLNINMRFLKNTVTLRLMRTCFKNVIVRCSLFYKFVDLLSMKKNIDSLEIVFENSLHEDFLMVCKCIGGCKNLKTLTLRGEFSITSSKHVIVCTLKRYCDVMSRLEELYIYLDHSPKYFFYFSTPLPSNLKTLSIYEDNQYDCSRNFSEAKLRFQVLMKTILSSFQTLKILNIKLPGNMNDLFYSCVIAEILKDERKLDLYEFKFFKSSAMSHRSEDENTFNNFISTQIHLSMPSYQHSPAPSEYTDDGSTTSEEEIVNEEFESEED